jgi:hypothetical protein
MWTFIVPVKASMRSSFRRVRPKAGIFMPGSRFLARFLGAPSIAGLRRRIAGDRRAMAEPGSIEWLAGNSRHPTTHDRQLPYSVQYFPTRGA